MRILLVMSMLTMLGGAAYGQYLLAADTKVNSSTDESWVGIQNRSDSDFFLTNPEKHPEIFCLAKNIYFEAGIDNKAGMYAVADVTLNRVIDRRWAHTVCGVVYEGHMRESWKTKQDPSLPKESRVFYPILHKCQFSWYCDGKPDTIPYGSDNWVRSQEVAWDIYVNATMRGITDGAVHYHATYVKPNWRKDRGMHTVGRIGAHIFYRRD